MKKIKITSILTSSIAFTAVVVPSITAFVGTNKINQSINSSPFSVEKETSTLDISSYDTSFVSTWNSDLIQTSFLEISQVNNLKSSIIKNLIQGNKSRITEADVNIIVMPIEEYSEENEAIGIMKGKINIKIELTKYYKDGKWVVSNTDKLESSVYENIQFKRQASVLAKNATLINDSNGERYMFSISDIDQNNFFRNKFPSEFIPEVFSGQLALNCKENRDMLDKSIESWTWAQNKQNRDWFFFFAPSTPKLDTSLSEPVIANDVNGTLTMHLEFSEWINSTNPNDVNGIEQNVKKTLVFSNFKSLGETNAASSFPSNIQIPDNYDGNSLLDYGTSSNPVKIKTEHATPKIFFENYLVNPNINSIPNKINKPNEFLEKIYFDVSNIIIPDGYSLDVTITSLKINNDNVNFSFRLATTSNTKSLSQLTYFNNGKWNSVDQMQFSANTEFKLTPPQSELQNIVPYIIYIAAGLLVIIIISIIVWKVISFKRKKYYLERFYGRIDR